MSGLKLGYNDIDNSGYHGDTEYYSSSSLKMMLKDSKSFYKKYIKGEPDVPKVGSHLSFGSYIHSLILEPELTDSEFIIYDKPKRGNAWKEFKAEHEDKEILNASQDRHAQQMIREFTKNKWATELIKGGEAEKTLCVELDGIKIKVRADHWNQGVITDLKTTNYGVSYEAIQKTMVQWDYDLSAALYCDAFTAHTGEHHDFYFVFLCKSTLGVEVYKASEQFLNNGRTKYKKAIAKIKEAKESGIWYNTGIQEIDYPTE